MSSIYTPRPAYQDLGGSIVLLSIVKRFPTFLQCEALFVALESDLSQVRVEASPLAFRDAVATLPVNAILGPVAAGVPLILYVSKPGFEEDFKEVAGDIAVDGCDLIRAAPDADNPFFLVFGKLAELPALAQRPPAASIPATLVPELPRETPPAVTPDQSPLMAAAVTLPPAEATAAAPEQPQVEPAPEAAITLPEAPMAAPEVLAAPAPVLAVMPEPALEMPVEAGPQFAQPVEVEWVPEPVSLVSGNGQKPDGALPLASPHGAETRRSDLARVLRTVRTLAAEGKPETLAAAVQLYDRAAVDYGDLWRDVYDTERVACAERLARCKIEEARQALGAGRWAVASAALAQAVMCPATTGEALTLQAALWAYLRGEIEKTQGQGAAAAASFAYAAAHCAELRERAGAQAQAAQQLPAQGGQDIQRLLTDQQAALLVAVEAKLTQMQDQMANRQLTVARQAEAEQSERQMTSLRHMQQEQATQLQALLVKLQNEQSEWQQETFKTLEANRLAQQQTQVERPAWYAAGVKELGRAVDEQGETLQAALKAQQDQIIALQKTISEWRSQKSARVDEPGLSPELGMAVSDLAWKVDTGARTVKGLSTRLGVLLVFNLLLLAALVAGFVWSTASLDASLAALRPVPAPTYGPEVTPALSLAATPEPTVVLTGVALKCADANRGRVYYECTLANGVAYPQTLSLSIAADGGKANGFFPSVTLDEKQIYPDLSTTLASLGRFDIGQLKHFRLNVPCAAALGCDPTTFVVRVVDSEASVVPGSEILITASSPAP
jgi:hypothetical protein